MFSKSLHVELSVCWNHRAVLTWCWEALTKPAWVPLDMAATGWQPRLTRTAPFLMVLLYFTIQKSARACTAWTAPDRRWGAALVTSTDAGSLRPRIRMLERASVSPTCGIRALSVPSTVNSAQSGERDSREDRISGRWLLFFVLLLGSSFLSLSDR